MSEFKKLSLKRKGYQIHIPGHITDIQRLCKNTLDDDTASQLRVSLRSLSDYRDKLETINSNILDSLDDDDAAMERETLSAAEYQEKMLQTIHLAEEKLEQSSKIKKEEDDRSSVASTSVNKTVTKLPRLEITPFEGDPIRWQEFWDTFSTTIHDRDDLDDIDKLKYLKGFITGDATNSIDGFRVTAANYSVVVETLKERYGDPEIAIFAHFERLLAMPSCQNDANKLQSVYDECEKHIRSLVALGLAEETFGKVFTPIILSKLPRGVRIQLCRSNGTKPWVLNNLRDLMREEIKAREMSDRYNDSSTTPKPKSDQKSDQKQHKSKPLPATQSSFLNQGNKQDKPGNQSKPNIVCSYCNSNHYSDQCDVYTTAEQRKEQLNGRCIRCLSADHQYRECKRTSVCYHCKKDNHHSSLCFTKFGIPKKNSKSNAKKSYKPKADSDVNQPAMMQSGCRIQMQMANVFFPNTGSTARIFFDSGSSRSYVTKTLADELKLQSGGNELITSSKFGDKRRNTKEYQLSDLQIPTSNKDSVLVSVLVTEHICCPIQKHPIDVNKNPILKVLPLADQPVNTSQQVNVDILIGQDYYYDFVGSERISLDNGMVLIQSKLGYLLAGKVPEDGSQVSENLNVSLLHLSSTPEQQLNQYWSLEDIGIKDDPYSKDDDIALNKFNSTVRLSEDGRYEVTWPWKPNCPELPTNYNLAFGSLKSLIKRFREKHEVLSLYDTTIQDQLTKGIIEPVQSDGDDPIHYIPHHPVIKKDRTTTKLRIVYNASARCGKTQPSLNDCLLRGPVYLADLCGMLIRFRKHLVAVSCDIEKAFLQVQLQPQDRDVTRFLWLKDVTQPVTTNNIVTFRFRRVPFGYLSSPFLLQGTVKTHLQHKGTAVSKQIDKDIYMDNVISGCVCVASSIEFYFESKSIFGEISMNLREWYSNSKELMANIPEHDRGVGTTPKVLGLTWDVNSDDLRCASFKPCDDAVLTKRKMLQTTSSLFDPCGWFSPIVIRGKMLVQKLWIDKVPWDKPVDESTTESFQAVKDDLLQIDQMKIPRMFNGFSTSENELSHELHCFCDASGKAYAAVVYLRSINANDGSTSITLVMSKARLAPTKPISLPRLELMACLIGTRLLRFVSNEIGLEITKTTVWSDSKCVLHWVHSNKVLTVFVENRVKEIKSNPFEFRYVPTNLNPADLPTRGVSASDLNDSSLWWNGPNFLVMQPSRWPENEFQLSSDVLQAEQPVAELAKPTSVVFGIDQLLDVTTFSSLSRLLRVSAWLLRFVNNCQSKNSCKEPLLRSADIAGAESKWLLSVQRNLLDDENESANIKNLGLFRDESGLVRCRGRLEHSSLPETAKYPILLPKNDPYTVLVIKDCHESLFHGGPRHTIAKIREKFWIPNGLSQVIKVKRACLICRKFEGGPFRVPETPPLPSFRVSRSEPFSNVGLDYLGPLIIKSPSNGSGISKVWLCLFTCAAVRAIHLEVVTDCSTLEFILCFRRFIAIRGKPNFVISDNAKTFVGANDFLRQIIKSSNVQDFAANAGINWKFIPALAPWMGGFYERLVGSVKRSLRKMLHKSCLTLSQLQTVTAEVASVINSRPLVPVDHDPGQLALTPAHFLGKMGRGGIITAVPNSDISPIDKNSRKTQLLECWVKGQKLLDQFWRSWHKEYLASLRDRPNAILNRKNSSNIPIRPDMVVLVKDPLQPRSSWKLGRVEKCHSGTDNLVRSATVRLANGRSVERAIKFLYPLEDSYSDNDNVSTEAEFMRSNQRLMNNPFYIGQHVSTQIMSNNIAEDPLFIFNTWDIYYTIMVHVVQSMDNEFHQCFVELINTHGSDLSFCVPSGNCFQWGSGLRLSQVRQTSPPYPGLNLYGLLLKKLARQHFEGALLPVFNIWQVFEKSYASPKPYDKTVLLLSDSQLRQLDFVQGGNRFPISGGTFGDVANTVSELNLDLSRYHYIIISCGVNDCKQPKHKWRSSFQSLCQLLAPLRNRSDIKVLINTALDVPKAPKVPAHTRWFKHQFKRHLKCRNFKLTTWSSRKHRQFLTDNGQLNLRLFFGDRFHVNHLGFGILWRRWCKELGSLNRVSYTMSANLYPGGSFRV